MKLMMCTSTAWVSESQMVTAGTLYRSDDQIVVDNPGLFTEDLSRYVANPTIEEATDNPGEVRRGPGRPRKELMSDV